MPDPFTCPYCEKTCDPSTPLQCCLACWEPRYCSEECLEAHWRKHRKVCSQTQAERAKSNYFTQKRFKDLEKGTWLHKDKSERNDVFKLIIDTYRMRLYDQAKRADDSDEPDQEIDIHAGACRAQIIYDFRVFLVKIEQIDRERDFECQLFPEWLRTSVEDLIKFAKKDLFSNIYRNVGEGEIGRHYADKSMPMQLKVFGEQLDGYQALGMSGAVTERMKEHHKDVIGGPW